MTRTNQPGLFLGFGWITRELSQLAGGKAVVVLEGAKNCTEGEEMLDYVSKCAFHVLRALKHGENSATINRVPSMSAEVKTLIENIAKHQG